MKKFINRDLYLDRIKPFMDKELIKVIVGQRRVGKSSLMRQIIELLKKKGIQNKEIIYINKEERRFDHIKNNKDLIKHIDELAKQTKKKKYLFVDEVQEIENFAKAIRAYNLDPEFDVFITGSNSETLSSDIAGLLSGRYIEFEVHSLNFIEFLKFHKEKPSTESLELFLRFGGMPYLAQLGLKKELVGEYIRNIYNTVILKDVVKRHKIRNIVFLEKLITFLADNVGFVFSANRISNYLKSNKIAQVDPRVIAEYLEYLLETFLFFQVKRKDLKGKKIFASNPKYYIGDLGFRNFILEERPREIDQIIENVVFLQLKSLGYNVTVGDISGKEIDFVAKKGDRKIYIQVAYLIPDKKVFRREFGNLELINDNYEKIVISMDPITKEAYKGIKHFKLLDFLTSKEF